MSRLRAACVALAFLLNAGAAWPHASLVSSMPADGAGLPAPPAAAVLQFDEPVSVLAVRLLDDTGAALELGTPRAEGQAIRVELPRQLRGGTYLLSYRVVSADSHPVAGAIAFAIGSAPSPVHAEPPAGASPGAGRLAARALRDLALLVAAGGALFVLGIGRFPGERHVLAIAGCVTACFAVAGIGLQGAALIGDAGAVAPESWRIAMRTSYGLSAGAAAAGGLTIAGAALLAGGRLRSLLLGAGALAAAASLPLTGHAATASPGALATAAVAAHGLAAAFWTGSLAALLALLRPAGGMPVAALRRFSGMAMVAVAVLFAAGVAFAVLQLSALSDLLGTRYGNLVLAKAVLFGALVGIAARNRFVLLALLERGVAAAGVRLRRAIAAELALIAAVVAVTAFLVHTPPERRIAATLSAGAHTAALTLVPGRAGPNAISVRFRDRAGQPYDPAEATLAIASVAAAVEPIVRPLNRSGPGEYRYDGGELAFPGRWDVTIRMRVDDFERTEFATTVELR